MLIQNKKHNIVLEHVKLGVIQKLVMMCSIL